MGRKKVTTTIYITPEQEAALKRLSQRTKVAVAEYVRQGIDLVLAQNGDALPGQLSFDYRKVPAPESAQGLQKK